MNCYLSAYVSLAALPKGQPSYACTLSSMCHFVTSSACMKIVAVDSDHMACVDGHRRM